MRRTITLAACAALWASSLAAQGAAADSLYAAWCARCHGSDARGTPAASTRLEVSPPDLASCAVSSAEPEDLWADVVARGGAEFGLSLDMPAYGEAASDSQIRMVVRYIKSLCRERGWPPGELNFPRAFLVEKAFPENEVVIVAHDDAQELIYERRFGPRFQIEAGISTVIDSLDRPFAGASAALKYNAWHSLARRALVSVGLEAAPPLGRRDRWELEPFVTAGIERAGVILQAEALAIWEETEGLAAASLRWGIARETGRVVPMVEFAWNLPRAGANQLVIYPQLWIRLSRLGHVAGSFGAEIPAGGVAPRETRFFAFLLWDFGDGPLLRGW